MPPQNAPDGCRRPGAPAHRGYTRQGQLLRDRLQGRPPSPHGVDLRQRDGVIEHRPAVNFPARLQVLHGLGRALADGFTFPLADAREDVQHHAPGGRPGIDLVIDGHQQPLAGEKIGFDQVPQVLHGAR